MITSYATGLIGIAAVLALWVAVQNAWRRAFPEVSGDGDVLAGRPGCQTCDRRDRFERNESCPRLAPSGACEEETA